MGTPLFSIFFFLKNDRKNQKFRDICGFDGHFQKPRGKIAKLSIFEAHFREKTPKKFEKRAEKSQKKW